VSTADIAGGAEKIAWNLFQSYRARGFESRLAVGRKLSDDPDVVSIPRQNDWDAWSGFWLDLEQRLRRRPRQGRGLLRIQTLLRTIAHPRRELEARFGMEDFNYPGSRRLLGLAPHRPDIVHCHNLHGGYFDLRVLPALSRCAPVVLTLHDAWLLSGHCAHSFGCQRWKTGCGRCPDLGLYPAVARDATAYNWRRKKRIFSRSCIYLSTPSKWLMQKVQDSLLRDSLAETRVIPNGVDRSIFFPAPKAAVRSELGLSQNATIVLFAAHRPQTNIYKDYATLRAAMEKIVRAQRRPMTFLCLGGEEKLERVGAGEFRFVPFQKEPNVVARYYQAADLYVHASLVDTFPCSVLEALACATPVIATEVGGIPEQVKGLRGLSPRAPASNRYGPDQATGVLVAAGDVEAMAQSIEKLAADDRLRARLGNNALDDARRRFDLQDQAERYLDWYEELLGRAHASNPRAPELSWTAVQA